MNFQTILEELDRLYEETEKKVDEEPVEEGIVGTAIGALAGGALANKLTEEDDEPEKEDMEEGFITGAIGGFAGTALANKLTEDDDDEVVIDGEPVEDAQLVLECTNCGALVIKSETDVTEEAGVANVGEVCQYCESNEDGYKVIGTFSPYPETEEAPVEESLKEAKTTSTIRGYEQGNTEFSTKIAKELQAKFGGEIKQIKTNQGSEDIWVDTKNKAKAANKYITKQYPDATFNYDEL